VNVPPTSIPRRQAIVRSYTLPVIVLLRHPLHGRRRQAFRNNNVPTNHLSLEGMIIYSSRSVNGS